MDHLKEFWRENESLIGPFSTQSPIFRVPSKTPPAPYPIPCSLPQKNAIFRFSKIVDIELAANICLIEKRI